MLKSINSINGVKLEGSDREGSVANALGFSEVDSTRRDEREMRKVEFGELVVLEAKQVFPEAKDGTENIEKYILFDTSTKRPVYWSPLDTEGLEKIKNVREAQYKRREDGQR